MATPNAFYSGDLAAINQGRTAQAAVDAADAASWRNYLAALTADRTRRQLGNRELDVRSALGEGELGVRRSDIGMRRELGLGELDLGRARVGEQAADRGARLVLGMGALGQQDRQMTQEADIRLKELKQQFDLKTKELELLKTYYSQGGGTDWRAADAMAKRNQEISMLAAEAKAIADQANATALTAARASKEDLSWWDTPDSRAAALTNNPAFGSTIRSQVITGLPSGDAALIEIDPATSSFVPRQSLFGRSIATPGINPTLPSPTAVRPWDRYQQLLKR